MNIRDYLAEEKIQAAIWKGAFILITVSIFFIMAWEINTSYCKAKGYDKATAPPFSKCEKRTADGVVISIGVNDIPLTKYEKEKK